MRQIDRQILAIGLPAIVSNITTPLLGMIDTAIVGHLGAAVYLGAIALGAAMFNMLYWLFGFLRMGSSGLTAQAVGSSDLSRISVILYRALSIGIVIGLLMILLRQPLATVLLRFIDSDNATRLLAFEYFTRVIAGAPAVMATFALSGWLLGCQDSRTIMWMSLLTNVVNILASLTLVFYFKMGLIGVATGTVIAQWSGLIFGLAVTRVRYKPQAPDWKSVFKLDQLAAFFKINFDIFLRTVCLVAVTMWFTRTGAHQGVDVLAANAILMQLFMFFSFFMDGFAFAAEALMGKFAGMKDRNQSRVALRALLRWGLIVASVFTVVYFLCGHVILGLLTDSPTVLSVADDYIPWAVTIPLAGMPAFIYDGVFIGITHTRAMLVSMLAASAIFFTAYIILFPILGNHGLWIAFIAYLLIRGIALAMIYPHIAKKL